MSPIQQIRQLTASLRILKSPVLNSFFGYLILALLFLLLNGFTALRKPGDCSKNICINRKGQAVERRNPKKLIRIKRGLPSFAYPEPKDAGVREKINLFLNGRRNQRYSIRRYHTGQRVKVWFGEYGHITCKPINKKAIENPVFCEALGANDYVEE